MSNASTPEAETAEPKWIKHDGGRMPVNEDAIIECLHSDGWNHYGKCRADEFRHWKWKSAESSMHNVTFYRVHEAGTNQSKRDRLRANDAVWAAFYRDGKTLGEIATMFECGVYDLSPWLTAPIVRSMLTETKQEASA